MKKCSLKRNTPLRAKTGLKAKTGMRRAPKAKSIGWWQRKCDALLTPIVKTYQPKCECCGAPTEVAHHWIEKSRSSYLRYWWPNLIALCHKCHRAIHNTFGNNIVGGVDVASVIIKKRGQFWKEEMDALSHKEQKVNIGYYKAKLLELEAKLSSHDT